MIWYFDDFERSRRERAELESLAASVDWLTPVDWRIDASLRMVWDADITTPKGVRSISLRYPNHFPHSPPSVFPRDASERWSEHQYGPGGELCLEYGSDNWHPGLIGADMVISAHRLLKGEGPSSEQTAVVVSRHQTTVGQDLRGTFSRLLVTRNLNAALERICDDVMLTVQFIGMYHGDSYVQVISEIPMPGGDSWREEMPSELGYPRSMGLFRWPKDLVSPTTASLSAFRQALAIRGMELPSVSYAVLVHGSRIRIFFLDEGGDLVTETRIIPPQPAAVRLDKEHEKLAGKKVAIVGCGSLGSKIATSLARAGVGRFLLVDDDVLLPDNLVRHDLDWREVGTHKADSVAAKIKMVNPQAECTTRRHRLGGQEASGSIETLIEHLGACDVIIDATANSSVFNYLSATVASASKPLVWAEIFGGGFGGLIARHRPGIDPSPASMRSIIEAWCRERGNPIERAENDYAGGADAPGIADDAEVAVIAAHTSRFAIDILLGRQPSMFPYSVYLIGLAKGWIFDQPFDTRPIDVGQAEPKLDTTIDEDLAATEMAHIRKLFKGFVDANSSPSSGEQTAAA
jgi:molybdopterin/thiamine biosynthesis adenylyltransferase